MLMAQKEYDYMVTLKKNMDKKVNIISLILLIISICIFLYTAIRLMGTAFRANAVICVVIAAFCTLWIILKEAGKITYYRLAFLVSGAALFFPPFQLTWLGILFLLIGLFEKQAKFPQEIGFDKEGITTNSIPSRFYTWNDVTNVVLRGGLLTIDFKTNKLYQKEVQNKVSRGLEEEFNAFCQSQIANSATIK